MRWKRWIGIVVGASGLAGLLWYGYSPQPVLVDAAPVVRGPMQVTIEEEGRTRVRDRYVISAPVNGYLRRIRLRVGDRVEAGQIVAEIEPPKPAVLDPRSRAELEARVRAAEAALREAEQRARAVRVEAAYWEGELARTQRLLDSGDIPRDRYERVLAEARRAEAALASADEVVRRARAELEAARVALEISASAPSNPVGELIRLRAPVGGRVLKVFRESEGTVAAGQPLVELADAQQLEVEVEVLSEDAVRIRPGTRVILEAWGGDQPLQGRVRAIEPVAHTKISALGVEEQRVTVIVDITSPRENWQRLGDGYRLEARFVLWESSNALQVPASALFRYENGWAVFCVENGRARRRRVKPGHRTGFRAEILEGLQEGQLVITHPDDSIEDGTPVKIRGQRPGTRLMPD